MSDDRRCLIVDGQAVVRLGVRELLDGRYEVEEAADLRGALDAMRHTGCFDVAILELDRRTPDGEPGGAKMIRAMRKASPGIGIVAHSRLPERHAAKAAIDAGAAAFVAKTSPPETLARAVDAAADASRYVDPATKEALASPLTKRQRQILQLLADGLSTTDAADRLGLSAETIRTHTKGLLARLAARDRTHAVAIGLRSGLID